MLTKTLQAVRSILTADPSVNPPERNRLLSLLRRGPEPQAIPTIAAPIFTEIIRRELAPMVKAMNDISASFRAVGQREADLTRQLDDVAPQVSTDRRKAQLAWIRKVENCSEIEKKAAILATEGLSNPEIAKRLPHKIGKAMTREAVRQALVRFATKAGQRGLFSKGTYRQNVRSESEADKPVEDGENLPDT